MATPALLDRVRRTLQRHRMLERGQTVLVAVSGGADSVALLHVLTRLAPALDLRLHVLHVDHQLRADSGGDAEFVRGLAARLGVRADVVRVRVPGGASLEAQARAARYGALEAQADRLGASRIAVGHTADDQAETVLMRLLSGTGMRGLAGIPPVRGRIVRPLIDVRRRELVALLERAGLSWREDPTNADPKFLRNRIRHDLLPELAASYRPDVVPALARMARLARSAVDAVDRLAAAELDRLAVREGTAITLPLGPLRALPAAVAAEVLRQAALRLGARRPLRAWAHRGLARLLASPPPRRPFHLRGLALEVSVGCVRLAQQPSIDLLPQSLVVPGRLLLPALGRALVARLVDAHGYAIPRGSDRAAFDADLVPAVLSVRSRRPGDRFRAFGGGARRLKQVLIDARVPRWHRGLVPVVEAGDDILWLAGLGRGAAAPITPATRRVLELALIPLAEDKPPG